MKTLAIFEIDGVLTTSSRACAVAKQALRNLDWEMAFVTSRPEERAAESMAWLAERIKISQFPKITPAYWCGRSSPLNTTAIKLQTFQALLRQHHSIERLVCFESDLTLLDAYESILSQRDSPRSYTLYRVVDGQPIVAYGSAVQATFPEKKP